MDEFTITNASGRLPERTNAVMHLSPNGKFFSIGLGNRTLDNGD